MTKPKVAILGATGMLGSVTLASFVRDGGFEVIATHRGDSASELTDTYKQVEFRKLDAEQATISDITKAIKDADWVVNAIGIIKPYIHDDNPVETERAIRINALFPHLLAVAAEQTKAKVIQIATDCVYSGQQGNYVETDVHDALDVYGKTKSLGEAHQDTMRHLRCSIIGPERTAHMSLMDWFLGQDKGAAVGGYTNHQWNGVTTLQFAKMCQGIIRDNISFGHLQHMVPGNLITKANLLKSFAKEFNRADIVINETEAPKVIDRTLATNNQDLNDQIWKAAGYKTPPTIEHMINELAAFMDSEAANK